MTEYPYVRAAFINAIAEEGTKEEAINYLQKQWNENCALRTELEQLKADLQKAHDGWQGEVKVIRDIADDNLARAEKAEAEIERLNQGAIRLATILNKATNAQIRAAEAERDSQEADFAKSIAIEVAARLKAEAERDASAKWLGELLAVIHRDGGHYQSQHGDEKAVAEAHRIVARLMTERDEALAQVAAAFEVAAENCARKAKDCDQLGFASYRDAYLAAKSGCKALTPADAKAALEAYGRKKMWEGMHLAATIAGQKSAVLPHHPDIIRGYAQGRSGARDAILAEMETLK